MFGNLISNNPYFSLKQGIDCGCYIFENVEVQNDNVPFSKITVRECDDES